MIKENLYALDCIRTYTGKYVNIFDPKPEMFCIEDIAHALSFQCRFSGHLRNFYSVAQHSLDVYNSVSDDQKLSALMHDASEAYLLDIPSPIKTRMPQYKEIEDGLMKMLADVFSFQYPLSEEVKRADKIRLEFEWHSCMLGGLDTCDCPGYYESVFLSHFKHIAK